LLLLENLEKLLFNYDDINIASFQEKSLKKELEENEESLNTSIG